MGNSRPRSHRFDNLSSCSKTSALNRSNLGKTLNKSHRRGFALVAVPPDRQWQHLRGGLSGSGNGCEALGIADAGLGFGPTVRSDQPRAASGVGAIYRRLSVARFELLLLAHRKPQIPVALAIPQRSSH